jgi:hypothetical protein
MRRVIRIGSKRKSKSIERENALTDSPTPVKS